MKTLDRKLLRDLRAMWSQALTIALVVASGVGGFLTSLSAVDSLAVARDTFYAEGRFADVFATVKRAPLALAEQIRALPGVADVQPTIEEVVRIDIAGSSDPVLGQLIGVDRVQPPRLNRVAIAQGRGLFDQTAIEEPVRDTIDALVSQGFAQARGLRPGDSVGALVNGRKRRLHIVGLAVSPEFVFAGLWGIPDQRGFGIFWVDQQALAAAYDMDGAFNTLAVRLAPEGARGIAEAEVIDALAQPLARYGGATPRGRIDQTSHAMLDNEIKEQRVLGTVLPSIFLGVAAFLLNVVISRIVATQREQIAALKALGYANAAIAAHYLKLVLLIVMLGIALGIVVGDWLGAAFVGLYAEVFHFAHFEHRMDPKLVLLAGGLTLGAGVLGTLSAILATVRLTPAEAMRPPAPGRFRRTLAERLGVTGLSPALRMILRNMERKPLRTGLSIGGIAAALAIVVMGNFFRDAIEVIVDSTFGLSMRSDVSVWMTEPADAAIALQFARLPGVLAHESLRDVQATLVNGPRRQRVMIRGGPVRSELLRIIDVDGRQTLPSGDGIVLTDRLADKLGLRVGDAVHIEVQEGRRSELTLSVEATVREMMGLNAYMNRTALNRALGEGDVATGFVLALERGSEARFLQATQGLPRAAGAFSKATMLRNMREVTARNILIMSTVLTLFAVVIAVGVVYNNVRIALAERAWELASLRVLGFTRAEVSGLLLGELAIGIVVALPLGMLGGYGLVHLITRMLKSDQFFFPVAIQPRTYALAALAVLVAAVASALVVRRRIDRLDMVAALKTRE
ncbi:ABC transporter permease [Variovorax ginsengisoli]|uniref:FtsX-like permease family protein n=1 Tax=Variovorax ginsengisoli TaxID=363844 RepID=A0ABT8SFX9_9BURK|nr:ABC transporter permease [Variovorax ginsengisoli]MDN8618664.1 FtsX-like permease family protein [Variovorax ginsengisoli]MDO1537834.1 FtsX-like permease family protein [Variovorax ginsengisoli]